MKQISYITGLMAILIMSFGLASSTAQTRVEVRLRLGDQDRGLHDQYYGICKLYNVPYRVIGDMLRAGVASDDIPIILYIKANSQYSLRQIYSLRVRGATWEQLSSWCGVRLYFTDHRLRHDGPPYGNAYGHYKKEKGRKKIKHDKYFYE